MRKEQSLVMAGKNPSFYNIDSDEQFISRCEIASFVDVDVEI